MTLIELTELAANVIGIVGGVLGIVVGIRELTRPKDDEDDHQEEED